MILPSFTENVEKDVYLFPTRHELERIGTNGPYDGPQCQTLSETGVNTEEEGPRDGENGI